MAFNANELFASSTRGAANRFEPRTILPKTFAPINPAVTLAQLTPMAFDTSLGTAGKWVVWANAGNAGNGANKIVGFVADQDGVLVDAALDTIGNILLAGKVHAADVVLPVGETLPNLQAALRAGPRSVDLEIEGLDGVH